MKKKKARVYSVFRIVLCSRRCSSFISRFRFSFAFFFLCFAFNFSISSFVFDFFGEGTARSSFSLCLAGCVTFWRNNEFGRCSSFSSRALVVNVLELFAFGGFLFSRVLFSYSLLGFAFQCGAQWKKLSDDVVALTLLSRTLTHCVLFRFRVVFLLRARFSFLVLPCWFCCFSAGTSRRVT